MALAVFVRLKFADIPLERDEGEYAYAGQLILHGVPPYALAYNMKFPGTYYAYAALMSVFGQSALGIRLGLLVMNAACIAMVGALGRRIGGTLVGGVAAAAFAVLSIDRWAMGPFAHATHFILVASLAGWLLLDRGLRLRSGQGLRLRSSQGLSLFAAGALMGVAITMKQQAAPLAVMAIVLAFWNGRDVNENATNAAPAIPAWRRAALVTAGIGATLLVMVLVLAISGVLGRFWFWTFQYAAAYVSEVPLSMATAVLRMAWFQITHATGWFWYAAILGVALLVLTRWPASTRRSVLAWLIGSAAAVVPGFFFRPHYFILLMPVAAILVGIAIASIDRVLARSVGAVGARVIALLAVAGLGLSYLQRDSDYVFRMGETELIRSLYAENPFLEAPEIGRYLAAHTKAGDRIAVLGSEPQIYFYANRPSATGYIYTYPLMEPQPYARRMASELRQEVEDAKPAYVVLSGVRASWGVRPGSDTSIITWASEYTARCYDLAGITDVNPRGPAQILWDAAAVGRRPQTESPVMIYRRKPGACGG